MGKKIKKKELEKLQAALNQQDQLLRALGVIEDEKHVALHKLAQVKEEVQAIQKELNDTYGEVKINVQSGEITEIPAEEKGE